MLASRLALLCAAAVALPSLVHGKITLDDVLGTLSNAAFCRTRLTPRSGIPSYSWVPERATQAACEGSATCSTCEWVVQHGFESEAAWQRMVAELRAAAGDSAMLALIKVATNQEMSAATVREWEAEAGVSFGSLIVSPRGRFFRTVASASRLQRVQSLAAVEDAVPLPYWLKLSPALMVAADSAREVNVRVDLAPQATGASRPRPNALRGDGVLHRASARRMTVRGVHASAVRNLHWTLLTHPHVVWVEPEPKFKMHNTFAKWLTQSGEEGATPIWDKGLEGQGEVVGCADSGVDTMSCFFDDPSQELPALQKGQVFESTTHRKVAQYVAFADGVEGVNGGHGTHVAGSILGAPAQGFSAYDGMARKAKLAFFDVATLGEDLLEIPDNPAEDMFPLAYRMGARIHSNSWGVESDGLGYSIITRDVDEYTFRHQDVLILFAVGNEGVDGVGSASEPSTAKNALAVGASMAPDQLWQQLATPCPESASGLPCQESMAAFSSIGPTYDGRIKPDVVAPGYSVWSANSLSAPTPGHCGARLDAGTSMATPITAGNAALLRQYFREGWYPSGTKTRTTPMIPMGALLKAMLINSGVHLHGTYSGTALQAGVDSIQGFGRVQLNRSMLFKESTFDLFALGNYESMKRLRTDESHEYTVEVTPAPGEASPLPLKVTLAWYDAPAAVEAASTLLNNLNLEVTAPGGAVLHPNGRTSADLSNTVEQVLIDAPTVGTYTVRVVGALVPLGPQPYALVITGSYRRSQELFGEHLPQLTTSTMGLPELQHIILPGARFSSIDRMNFTMACGGQYMHHAQVVAVCANAVVVDLGAELWGACTPGSGLLAEVELAGYEKSAATSVGKVEVGASPAAKRAMGRHCGALDSAETCALVSHTCEWNSETDACESLFPAEDKQEEGGRTIRWELIALCGGFVAVALTCCVGGTFLVRRTCLKRGRASSGGSEGHSQPAAPLSSERPLTPGSPGGVQLHERQAHPGNAL